MAPVTANQKIVTCLTGLGEQLHQLRRMVDIEDSAPHLVEELHAHTLTVIGHQVCALEAARLASAFAERPGDIENNSRALATCTMAVQDCCRIFYENLYTVSRITDMMDLLKQVPGDSWAYITIRDLTVCHLSLQATSFAMMDGWQELARRAGASSVSVHSNSVGQQFMFPTKYQP